MKKFLLLLIGAVVLFSCKDDKEEEMGLPPVINLEENRYYVEVGASQVISPTYENTDNETLYLWTRDGKQVGHEPTYTFKMSTAGTYYLKVSGTMRVAVAASYKAVANKSGATKASAYALTRNKTIRSILASGENKATADWYKFYMPSKVMYMELASAGTASIAYDIYGPSYAKGIYAGYTSSTKSGRKIYSTAGGVKKAVKPGWYYLKVYRLTTSSNSSGVYSVKWYY